MSETAPTGSQMSYEKLLLLAKQLKAKTRKLEQEKEALQNERDAAMAAADAAANAASTMSSHSSISANNIQTKSPHTSSDKTAAAPADDPILFWAMISRASPLQQRLSSVALRALIRCMTSSALGRQKLCMKDSASTATAFARWRAYASHATSSDLQAQLAASHKTIQEQQLKVSKLKALLARTHTASKQQAEDAQRVKEEQKSANMESRQYAAEHAALMEQMRAREVQSAFQRDLELVIQSAADGLEEKGILLKEQLRERSALHVSPALDNGPTDGVTARSEETHVHTELNRDAIAHLESEVSALKAALEAATCSARDSRMDAVRCSDDAARATDKLAAMQKELILAQRLFADEQAARREIEMDLDITIRGRSAILTTADQRYQQEQQQSQQKNQEGIEQLRAQCEQSERKLTDTLKQLEGTRSEVKQVRAALAAAQRSRGDVKDLRMQIVELRRSIKRGSGAPSTPPPQPKLSEQRMAELCAVGASVANRAAALAGTFRSYSAEIVALRNALHTLLHKLLDISQGNLPDASSLTHFHAKREHLLTQIALVEREKQELMFQAEVSTTGGPLVWESSRVDIASGRSIELIIPSSISSAQLSWQLSGSAGSIEVALRLQDEGTEAPKSETLSSEWSDKDESYVGSTRINVLKTPHVLSIKNCGWVSTSIGYYISVTCDQIVPELDRVSSDALQIKLQGLQQCLQNLESMTEINATCAKLRSSLLEAEVTEARASNISQHGDGTFASAAHLSEIAMARKAFLTALHDLCDKSSADDDVAELKNIESRPLLGTLQSEQGLVVASSNAVRLDLPFATYEPPFTVSWNVTLHEKAGKDIGFTVMLRRVDGALPQLVPYAKHSGQFQGQLRVAEQADGDAVVIMLDNQFSWVNKKALSYTISVYGESDDKEDALERSDKQHEIGSETEVDVEEAEAPSTQSFAVNVCNEPTDENRILSLLRDSFRISVSQKVNL